MQILLECQEITKAIEMIQSRTCTDPWSFTNDVGWHRRGVSMYIHMQPWIIDAYLRFRYFQCCACAFFFCV